MHILFILDYFPPYIGGIETLFDDVTNFGVEHGYTINILTSRHDKKLPIIEKRKGVTIYRIGTNRFTIVLQALRFGIKHKSLLQSIDHIHTSTFSAAIPARILSKIYKKTCTITIHEIYDRLRYHLKGNKAKLYLGFEKLLLWLPRTHIITVSNYTKHMIQDIHHLSESSFSVIYNQINTYFRDINTVSHEDIHNLKKTYNLTHRKIGLFVGRLGYEKGLPYLIEAMNDIITTHNNFTLIIIAPKNGQLYSQDIQKQIKATRDQIINSNLHNHIIRIDPVKDEETLRLWMATSDIGIIPSMSEGFCYTAVQMQAMGLPLIVSKVGALPEVLASHHTFIGYGKIKQLSNVINKNLNLLPKRYLSERSHTSINYQAYYDIFEYYNSIKK